MKRGRRNGKWQGFVEYRRQYISDRTWFGLAFFAIGFGNFGAEDGWTRVLLVAIGLLGVAMVASGVRRAWRGTDPVSHEQRLSPPW